MARGGKVGYKRKTRNKVRLEKTGSDESDEDYMVDEDEEFGESEEDYCSSLADDESEASLGEFDDEEEEEWVEKKELKDENPTSRKRKTIKEWGWGRRKKVTETVNSESDFVSSESSDYDYTISEEEREQVREATVFCKRLSTNLRSSSSLKMVEEEKLVPSKGKRPGRKGKQKVVDLNIEIGKQVCGICLSEEGKKTVKGVLNCCSHYFCFACIMEWSKVESRCPLCKQRFATISRTARTDGGHDLRDAVFPVPERDQVYQPSEEELRGYLDPYENVLCTECMQGGDDALMLLCDLCDSPAHTFCVGLGREVPDGNWYCDGCRPTALASSNAQGLNPTTDQGASNNLSVGSSPGSAVRETFDLNEAYVPDTPLSQVNGHSQSPRHSIGHLQPTSPAASGSGAFTLHDRRRIQRVIHQFLSRSRQSDGTDGLASASAINLFGSPIGRGVIATQNTVMPRIAAQNIFRGRLADYNTPSLYNREAFSPRLSNLRGDALQSQASTSNGHTFGGISQSEYAGINARMGGGLGQQQLHPCSATPNTGADASASPFQFTEATLPSRTLHGSLHTRF
ncbi:hypothetical protein C2S51_002645 [Perilla frutescens var. frutescens]|nr:hypothetical protein C2S51_002645 [Perilla frutescens var. frutescens]